MSMRMNTNSAASRRVENPGMVQAIRHLLTISGAGIGCNLENFSCKIKQFDGRVNSASEQMLPWQHIVSFPAQHTIGQCWHFYLQPFARTHDCRNPERVPCLSDSGE